MSSKTHQKNLIAQFMGITGTNEKVALKVSFVPGANGDEDADGGEER